MNNGVPVAFFMNMNWKSKLSIFIICVSIVLISLGCGESSLKNPIEPETNESTPAPQKPTVTINISKSAVTPGESVKITATVSAVNGSKLMLNWVNTTGYGELSNISQNSVTWTAPDNSIIGEVRVEVIQLIITVISHVISVKESGVDTKTNIETVTKTIPITITN